MYPSFPPATKFHEICLGGVFLRDLAKQTAPITNPRLGFLPWQMNNMQNIWVCMPLYKYGMQMCIQTNRVPCLHLASTQNNELTASVQAEHMD